MTRRRGHWMLHVPGALVVAAAANLLGSGAAYANGLEQVEVQRVAVVFGDLDSLSPPIIATLEPGRDVAYLVCRDTPDSDMVYVRFAARDAGLPSPADVGWTYIDALGPGGTVKPC